MGTVPTLCGLKLANVEAYEQLYPVRIHRYEMRCDAAGAGEYRGGNGIDYEADVDVPADYSFRSEGAETLTAFGVNGGASGRPGSVSFVAGNGAAIDAPQFGVRRLPPLRVRIASPAGGGLGHPWQRPPEKVLRDVMDGLVSREQAESVYGVVISQDPLQVDMERTRKIRDGR
jgi:N-methylhydantoinase B